MDGKEEEDRKDTQRMGGANKRGQKDHKMVMRK